MQSESDVRSKSRCSTGVGVYDQSHDVRLESRCAIEVGMFDRSRDG
jgi:hypothetical protein